MKKFLSIFLTLLLLFTLASPALAEVLEGENDVETSEESRLDDTPSAPDPEPGPAPEPEPGPGPSSDPAPAPDPEPEPAPAPAPAPEPDVSPEPAPDLPEAPPEAPAPDIENPPLDLDASGLPSGSGSLDAPTYDVTKPPTGDIIIEEHSYTRTVDVSRFPAGFNLSDLIMRYALTAVFGEYQPKTQTVSTYYDGQLLDTSTEYVPGIAGMDMEWIAGVIIFTVLLFCLMKLLGGVFK